MLTGILYTRFWPHFYVGCWLILWPQMKSPNNSYITFWCWFPVMIQFLRKLMSTLIFRILFTQKFISFTHAWNCIQYPVEDGRIFLNSTDGMPWLVLSITAVFAFVGSNYQIHFYYTFVDGAAVVDRKKFVLVFC